MSPEKLVSALRESLAALDAVAADASRWTTRADRVSGWSVAQHAAHLAEANLMCLRAVAALLEGESERIRPSGSPTMAGRAVLTLGFIPRGKGTAPEPTRPQEEPRREDVQARLAEGRAVLDAFAGAHDAIAAAPGRLPHPLLGDFSAKDWLRFTDVHVRHHLAIAKDVVQRSE